MDVDIVYFVADDGRNRGFLLFSEEGASSQGTRFGQNIFRRGIFLSSDNKGEIKSFAPKIPLWGWKNLYRRKCWQQSIFSLFHIKSSERVIRYQWFWQGFYKTEKFFLFFWNFMLLGGPKWIWLQWRTQNYNFLSKLALFTFYISQESDSTKILLFRM